MVAVITTVISSTIFQFLLGFLTRPDGRAGDGIWTCALVDVVDDTWRCSSVSTWESNLGTIIGVSSSCSCITMVDVYHLRRAGCGSAAGDGDLEARGVELDSWILVGCRYISG